MEETHDDVIRQKHLPRVGQTVRSLSLAIIVSTSEFQ